jgi:DNA-binding transcriptional LysR family regulator
VTTDNLTHLAAFAAVARHCSFARAAVELGLSPSAVSYAIRGLEERLGVSLFNRTTRSVALTDAGQRLLQRLAPALGDIGDALEEMNTFRAKPAGTLRINTSRAAAHLLLAPLIPRFLAAYPDVQLDIVDDDALADIVGGGFDVGVRFEESVPEDMVAVALGGRQRSVVIAAPGYLRGRSLPEHPRDLAGHDCIRYRFPSGRVYKWEFEKDGVELEIDVKGRVTLGDPPLCVQAALQGVGVAFMVEGYVDELVAQGRLVRLLEDWCPHFPGFMLYYPRQRRMSPALRAFIDLARQLSMPSTLAESGEDAGLGSIAILQG